MSETILWALAGEIRNCSVGDDISSAQIDRVMALAGEHGFGPHEPPLDALDESSQNYSHSALAFGRAGNDDKRPIHTQGLSRV